jgi:BirA family biotin operon repressor/biotin-[acetyl-CoA-carboxylase] ligase
MTDRSHVDAMHFQILRFDSLDSTNREAADQARRGAPEGVTIVADEQTAGRGRQGRNWTSTKGSGAYFSTILRPTVEARYFTLIPLLAAVAVHDALLEGWSIDADIKWPNDVLVDGKKICGVLSEMIDTPAGNAIILGIGINLRDVDPDLNATSIETHSTTPASRDDVVAAVHRRLAVLYDALHTSPGTIVEQWSRYSSYSNGMEVNVDAGHGEPFTGTTCGLEPNGALRVRLRDGSVRIVQAGDVTRLRKV